MKKCLFAGTFDPPTVGHKAVVERALKVFDEVIVAILINPEQQPPFTVAERKNARQGRRQGGGREIFGRADEICSQTA